MNLPTFKKIEDLGDNVAEIELVKSHQKLNLPIQIGFAILQYAKFKMLEWYYDFLLEYIDKSDFEYIEKLGATSLPPPEAFYSILNQKSTLGEGLFIYSFTLRSTARDILRWLVYRWRKPVHTAL